jgi:Ca-activated chloride channel family protein
MSTTSSYPRRVLNSCKGVERLLLCAVAFGFVGGTMAQAQLPYMNAGPDSAFAQIDFAQIYLDTGNRQVKKNAEQQEQRKHLVDSGAVSTLDLDAPGKAIDEFNTATTLLKAQKSKEAIAHLQKAIAAYPKFVIAHNTLGLAYLDQEDGRAKDEFEAAAKLDEKFPGSFLNLGLLALSVKDFGTARSHLEKAASLSSKDPKILSALAFAENGDHQYQQTLETTNRVHALDHRGMANVHYIAAAAALSLSDLDKVQTELKLFLGEDPTNPLAPVARKNLDTLAHRNQGTSVTAGSPAATTTSASATPQTLANSKYLAEQVNSVAPEVGTAPTPAEPTAVAANANSTSGVLPEVARSAGGAWTIRKSVDETALFFAVSSHGHMVSDLDLSNIQIRDDNKPPEKVLQFVPQSKLPLRLGLLIDTSGSVQTRFSFEKNAASKFLEKVLNGTSDLGFVAGFSSDTTVTQDFTADPAALGKGVETLTKGGGTALFDAISLASWKLAAYPEQERVARVLVVLSDGEDNSSHRSLKQVIEDAETKGVTIYTLSTSEDANAKTDADRVLQLLAERSGGESMFPGDMMALDKSLGRLRDLIRSRYLIAYKAAGFAPNGKYRTIHIDAEKDGKHLQVHARKGYYARVESPNN